MSRYRSFIWLSIGLIFLAGGVGLGVKYKNVPECSFSTHKVAHISFDDVVLVLKELRNEADRYESIFDCRFLRDLRDLHNDYGAKFSLYIFEHSTDFNIAEMPLKFKKEFKANASWLKFGFHATDPAWPEKTDLRKFDLSFSSVLKAICEFADSSSISPIIRLHYYYATDSMVSIMERTGKVKGLLCADDERNSYNLSQQENYWLQKHFFVGKSLKYFKTNLRYENVWCMDYSLALLQNRDTLVFFTHEWAYLPQTPRQWLSRRIGERDLSFNWRTRCKLRKSIKWLKEHKYKFEFLE